MNTQTADRIIETGKPVTVRNVFYNETFTETFTYRNRYSLFSASGGVYDRAELELVEQPVETAQPIPTEQPTTQPTTQPVTASHRISYTSTESQVCIKTWDISVSVERRTVADNIARQHRNRIEYAKVYGQPSHRFSASFFPTRHSVSRYMSNRRLYAHTVLKGTKTFLVKDWDKVEELLGGFLPYESPNRSQEWIQGYEDMCATIVENPVNGEWSIVATANPNPVNVTTTRPNALKSPYKVLPTYLWSFPVNRKFAHVKTAHFTGNWFNLWLGCAPSHSKHKLYLFTNKS